MSTHNVRGSVARRSLLLGGAGLALGTAVNLGSDGEAAMAYSPTQTRGYPLLRSGSTGTAVRVVQGAVGSGVDGVFGVNTRAAVINFQRGRGLSADGVVGVNTWAAMITTVQSGSTGVSVRGLQAGLGGVAIDGIFGAGTLAGLRTFQSKRGLGVDGVAGPATWGSMIGSAAGGGQRGPRPTIYANGNIPASALSWVGWGSWRMATYCIDDFRKLADAYLRHFGSRLPITGDVSAYRDYAAQVRLRRAWELGQTPFYAAVPGTSNHGWGLAVDVKVDGYNTAKYRWMSQNAPSFGFFNDVPDEAHHWAYHR